VTLMSLTYYQGRSCASGSESRQYKDGFAKRQFLSVHDR
jgi:hypothetical protein